MQPNDRPPVSGEPPHVIAVIHRELCERFETGQPNHAANSRPGYGMWDCERIARAIEAEASTGAALDVERPYITSEDMWDAWIVSRPQDGDRHMIRLAEAVNRRIHRPPVSGEPRHQWTEIARRLEAEGFDGDDRRSQSARIIEVGRAIAIVREASTGAAMDVERLQRIENALLRSAGFFPWEDPHGEAWIHRDDEGYVMDRRQAVNDALARLRAEQEGEGR